MNKTYRSVWNESTGTWVAASENARARKKSGAKAAAVAVVGLGALGAMGQAAAFSAAGGNDGSGGSNNNNVAIGSNAQAPYGGGIYVNFRDYWARPDGSAVTPDGTGSYVYSIAIGPNASAPASSGGTAIGTGALSGASGVALGAYATSSGKGGNAIGMSAVASGAGSTAIGEAAVASGSNAYALGDSAWSSGTNSMAFGTNAVASGDNSVALGAGSKAGSGATATTGATIGGTAYKFAGVTPASTVSVGSAGSERTITNVAAGQLSASSTDAVNGSELYATNSQVTANTTSITNLTSSVTNIQGQMADAVKYDSSAHNSVTLGGAGTTSHRARPTRWVVVRRSARTARSRLRRTTSVATPTTTSVVP